MKNIELIIKLLPKVFSIVENVEEYLKSKSQNIDNNELNLQISNIHHDLKNLFGELPNDIILFNEINNENINNWKNLIISYTFKQSIEFLKLIYVNPNKNFDQINANDIKNFLQVANKINTDVTTTALLYIFLAELCRSSDPVLSFNLITKAFETKIDLGINLGLDHLKNYIYNHEIINNQKRIENCTICGGQGVPFHNAPSYKMINYNQDFLPSKLWLKCNDCNNLYTQYFPSKFFERKNDLKIITPNSDTIDDIIQIPTYLLSNWCNILQSLKQYTKGKNILEIGIGNGAFIATALEMDYNIECIEIEEYLAQKISNLLDHNIICCDFLDLPENKKYDIISMGDVIEHLDNPKKGLKKVYNLLNEYGVLWISTPNYKSAFNTLHKMNTAMWNEPWHITYFFKNGLENLLDESGFKILDYRISTHYNGSMEIIANKKG